MEDLLQKNTWPGWETVRMIGKGSFGNVFEIRRDVFGAREHAALKVISIPFHDGDIDEMYAEGYDFPYIAGTYEDHLKRIVSEYSLMRKLSGCSNVVNCDDVRYVQHPDNIGWDVYIKMELLTPLTKALPQQVDEQTVIKLGRDLCQALVLCQHHGIIHRDIKPQNIFVSENADFKLGDFGIAKTADGISGGTKAGTYKYMAPEVYNNRPYGTAADIYSLGLVLYWLLNQRRGPFVPLGQEVPKASEEENARDRRFSGEPLQPPRNGSRRLQGIVLKACAFDPARRYTSAQQMLTDLEALMQNTDSYSVRCEPVETPTPQVEAPAFQADDPAEVTFGMYGVKAPSILEEPKTPMPTEPEPEDEPEEEGMPAIRYLRTLVEQIEKLCDDKAAARQLRSLGEELRYSDPVSNVATGDIEKTMCKLARRLRTDVSNESYTSVAPQCRELKEMLVKRNYLCKQYKKL